MPEFCHPHWWRFHHHRVRVVLIVGDFAVELMKEEVVHMATELKVGQTLPLGLAFLDQNGQPMVTKPQLDAPPVWEDTSPSVGTLTVISNEVASEHAIAAGSDTVRVTLHVGGTQFSATLDVTVPVIVPTQTLTTVEIVPGAVTP
jgi:hypothetical protein